MWGLGCKVFIPEPNHYKVMLKKLHEKKIFPHNELFRFSKNWATLNAIWNAGLSKGLRELAKLAKKYTMSLMSWQIQILQQRALRIGVSKSSKILSSIHSTIASASIQLYGGGFFNNLAKFGIHWMTSWLWMKWWHSGKPNHRLLIVFFENALLSYVTQINLVCDQTRRGEKRQTIF